MTSEGGQGVVSTASLGAFSILSTSSTLDSNRSVGHLLSWVGLVDSVRAPELKVGCPVSTSEAISNKRDWPFKLQNNQLCTLFSGSASENTASFAAKCQCLAMQSGVLGCST